MAVKLSFMNWCMRFNSSRICACDLIHRRILMMSEYSPDRHIGADVLSGDNKPQDNTSTWTLIIKGILQHCFL